MPAFDVLVNNVRKDVVERLYADADLRVKLITHNWPTDEETCKKIAEKFDLAEEEVGAVGNFCKETREAGRELGIHNLGDGGAEESVLAAPRRQGEEPSPVDLQ